MTRSSERTERIVVERASATRDSHNEPVENWAELGRAYAAVRWGSGQERIENQQRAGVQAATFTVAGHAAMRAATIRDRIVYRGAEWNIVAIATPVRGEIAFTAERSV